jgi:hypothetical protein
MNKLSGLNSTARAYYFTKRRLRKGEINTTLSEVSKPNRKIVERGNIVERGKINTP